MSKYKRRPKCHAHCKRGRHVFTREECKRGYNKAKITVDRKYPDWKCQHGLALSHCLLRSVNPQAVVLREKVIELEQQVARIEENMGRATAKIRRIRRELTLLKKHGSSYNGNLRSYIGEMGMIEEGNDQIN